MDSLMKGRSEKAGWQYLWNSLRRRLAPEGQRVVVTRGQTQRVLIMRVQTNSLVGGGPVLAKAPLLREWLA